MTSPLEISFIESDPNALKEIEGQIAVLAAGDGKLDALARKVNTLTRGAITRIVEAETWAKTTAGQGVVVPMPHGLAAMRLIVVKLDGRPDPLVARCAGSWIAANMTKANLTLAVPTNTRAAEIAYGVALRAYTFDVYKTDTEDDAPAPRVAVMTNKPESVAAASGDMAALAEGVFFTRDLVNEPANTLTTLDFAARLAAMQELGLDVEILEEPELEALGMRTLLGVGLGSESPSRVVVMQWNGGGDEAPLAIVGKGVVFDTGGISLKPASGMEDMTMDMGGAGVVSGLMRSLALRRAKANVVGVVGLVENMPDGKAMRPGDIVKSMKGDTIEVINTDAEGRLVLADALWYTQDRFKPSAMINLATLTGAIIIGLGHHMAGVFANDDDFAGQIIEAAGQEGEGAWQMPMGPKYDKQIKSRLADIKNTGGRAAGSITAAQFLGRFVPKDLPWAHLDIAGVTSPPETTDFAPKGATGWGVMTLNRLIRNHYEG